MTNYRKKYEDYFKIKIEKNYVIHHIDFDRNNNDISNLVMLPSDLHKRYHFYLNIINQVELPKKIISKYEYAKYLDTETYSKFVKVLKECSEWIEYRNYLEIKKMYFDKGE